MNKYILETFLDHPWVQLFRENNTGLVPGPPEPCEPYLWRFKVSKTSVGNVLVNFYI